MPSLYQATIDLLHAGAFIEQISETPQIYQLRAQGQRVTLPGGVVQQLFANRAIRQACRVSGQARFVCT